MPNVAVPIMRLMAVHRKKQSESIIKCIATDKTGRHEKNLNIRVWAARFLEVGKADVGVDGAFAVGY
jgi:hypothetical protein